MMADEKSTHVVNIVHETGLVETVKGNGYFLVVATDSGYFIGQCGLETNKLFREIANGVTQSLKHCPPDDIPEFVRKLLTAFEVPY